MADTSGVARELEAVHQMNAGFAFVRPAPDVNQFPASFWPRQLGVVGVPDGSSAAIAQGLRSGDRRREVGGPNSRRVA